MGLIAAMQYPKQNKSQAMLQRSRHSKGGRKQPLLKCKAASKESSGHLLQSSKPLMKAKSKQGGGRGGGGFTCRRAANASPKLCRAALSTRVFTAFIPTYQNPQSMWFAANKTEKRCDREAGRFEMSRQLLVSKTHFITHMICIPCSSGFASRVRKLPQRKLRLRGFSCCWQSGVAIFFHSSGYTLFYRWKLHVPPCSR